MFIGHIGLALAAKRVAPKTSLGTLLLATQFADFIWPIFLVLGIEEVRIAPGITPVTPLDFVHYPWSHSLLMGAIWAILFAGIYYAVRRYPRGALVIAIGVLSHWVLDWISHRPDMPITPQDSTLVGLGLWYSRAATITVELPIYVVGIFIFLRATSAKDRIGTYAFWALIIFLFAIWANSLSGSPPPSMTALKGVALLQWILLPWAYWIDRHRPLSQMI